MLRLAFCAALPAAAAWAQPAADGIIDTVAGDGSPGYGGDGGAAAAAQLNGPFGVAPDGAGNLYIADTFNNRIRKVDAATSFISTVAGDGSAGDGGDGGAAAAAQLDAPSGVALDGAGNLYIADTFNNRIRKVDAATSFISTVAGDGSAGYGGDGGAAAAAQLQDPFGVAADGAGNLYIADANNNRIRKVDAATGFISTVVGDGSPGYGGDGGAAAAAQLSGPLGVAADGAGNLYIADTFNYRIRKVIFPPPPPGPGTAPAALSRTFELSFVLRQDDGPASRQVVLYAEDGAADFRLKPSQRWITVEPASGSLAEGEETMVEVTADPAGLRTGEHAGRLYVRSGGRVTARVRIELEVLPPRGPAVSERGVVNAAAMSALGAPGLFGAAVLPLAPGSLVVVQGENFTSGSGAAVAAEGFPLPARRGGATVRFAAAGGAGGGLAARLLAVGPQRIEAQLPFLLGPEAGETAPASVVVETAEGSSYPRRFLVAAHAPGVFTISGEGTGQAAALLAGAGVLAAPRGAVGESRPARAGDVLEIYATGLGPVQPPIADGENSCGPQGVCLADGSNALLRRTVERPRVSIGGVEVAAEGVLFSGLAPALAGVNLVVVETPQGIAPSDAAKLVLAIGGKASQAGVTIAVE